MRCFTRALFLSALLLAGCDGSSDPADAGDAVDASTVDDGRIPCSDPAPTNCYDFNGSCTRTAAVCRNDFWSCTTPEDYAEMMIACETGPPIDAGF